MHSSSLHPRHLYNMEIPWNTRNDGLEKAIPFQYGHFWVSMLDFHRVNLFFLCQGFFFVWCLRLRFLPCSPFDNFPSYLTASVFHGMVSLLGDRPGYSQMWYCSLSYCMWDVCFCCVILIICLQDFTSFGFEGSCTLTIMIKLMATLGRIYFTGVYGGWWLFYDGTLPETNISPENKPIGKQYSNHPFF